MRSHRVGLDCNDLRRFLTGIETPVPGKSGDDGILDGGYSATRRPRQQQCLRQSFQEMHGGRATIGVTRTVNNTGFSIHKRWSESIPLVQLADTGRAMVASLLALKRMFCESLFHLCLQERLVFRST